MNATLALEDGTWYRGVAAGAPGEAHGEVVFNTSMTGYQEVLTDPSYAGQIVTMTAPQIGNYGVDRRRRRIARTARGRVHHARGVAAGQQLARGQHAARLPGQARHRGDRRHRHARADARAAVGRRDARRHRHRARGSRRRWSSKARADSEDGGRRPGEGRHLRRRRSSGARCRPRPGRPTSGSSGIPPQRDRRRAACAWRPTTWASSTTSCGGWTGTAATSRCFRPTPRRPTCWRRVPTASS